MLPTFYAFVKMNGLDITWIVPENMLLSEKKTDFRVTHVLW